MKWKNKCIIEKMEHISRKLEETSNHIEKITDKLYLPTLILLIIVVRILVMETDDFATKFVEKILWITGVVPSILLKILKYFEKIKKEIEKKDPLQNEDDL